MKRGIIWVVLIFLGVSLVGAQFGYDNPNLPHINTDRFNNATFAEMWNYTSAGWTYPVASAGVYYNLTGLAAGELNSFIFTADTQANGGSYLTATEDGLYSATFVMSFASAGVGADYGVAIVHDFDVETHRDCYGRRTISANGAIGAIAVSCIMDISAGDNVNIQVEDETNPPTDITVYTANLNLRKLEISEIVRIINNTGGGTFDNTNIAYLNNTQTFTGFNTFNENITLGVTDCVSFGSGKAYICGFGTGDLRVYSDDQFELWNSKATGVINITANNLTYNGNELCTKINGLCEEATINIFDQWLNKSSNVTFNNITSTGYLTGDGFQGTMQTKTQPVKSDACYNRDTDNIYRLNITDITGVDYVIYTASGYTYGCDTASWKIEIHNASHTVLETERTGTWTCGGEPVLEPADNWFVRGYDFTPEEQQNYHLNLDEYDGTAQVCVVNAQITVVLE